MTYMNKDQWLLDAKRLPLGHSTRVDCPKCGGGTNTRAMKISHDLKAYSGFCFACDNQPFEMKGKQTLESIAELKRLNHESLQHGTGEALILPEDFTRDIPLEGRLWLYSNGITNKLRERYGIGYSARLHRVVLPVYNEAGTLIWYQCRALREGQTPKYLQPSRDKTGIYFASQHIKHTGVRTSVTVVEDIMSAIRVGESDLPNTCTISLLGTKADTRQVITLSDFSVCTLWYDNDKAGIRGSQTIRTAVSMLTETRNIRTELDPKAYSNQQIRATLCQKK